MQRLCRMNGAYAGTSFAVKCMAKEQPFRVLLGALSLGICVFGYSLRVLERPASAFSSQDLSVYSNSFWCIIATMTTVGYGDYYPSSSFGRLLVFVACIYGVTVVSLMVVSSSNFAETDRSENRTLLVIKRLEFKEGLRTTAAGVIGAAVRYWQMKRRGGCTARALGIQLGRIRRGVNEFQRLKLYRRNLYSFDSFEDRVEQQLALITRNQGLLLDKINALQHAID